MAANSHAGRPGSWLAVIVIWIGFGVGGAAMVAGPAWWLFWTGVGIAALGGIIALAVHIFDDVIVDAPRTVPEEPHHSRVSGRQPGSPGEIGGPGLPPGPAPPRPHG